MAVFKTKSESYYNDRPQTESRWKDYNNYKLILLVWMLNDVALVMIATDISHSGFYFNSILHAMAVIFIGLPLVYTEICLAQYTNFDAVSMWNFFPLFRCVGYGTVYLVLLKTIYVMVLASWYLVYTFYAAMDPPPWFTCDEFNVSTCMVKRINISVFQHCVETQNLYEEDCGLMTSSHCFFDREIGGNISEIWPNCMHPWKVIGASCAIGCALFIISTRKTFIQIAVKLVIIYLVIVVFVLFCVALSTSGTWYANMTTFNLSTYTINNFFFTISRGFISTGTGYGMIIFLSREVPFRSPATMTSITISLVSIFMCLMFALIAFSGIKTMSYFHGEEENIIELGESYFFTEFASISEILSYLNSCPIWSFAWFSAIFLCLFLNLWLLFTYLKEHFFERLECAQRYKNMNSAMFIVVLICLTCPFYCSDITPALTDATETIQIISSLFFSFSIYWIYGYYNHNVDIIFMIGIKASYFWKITWLVNPLALTGLLYSKFNNLGIIEQETIDLEEENLVELDKLVFSILMGIYAAIMIIGILIQVVFYYRQHNLRGLFVPNKAWGPKEDILYKSRKMFVPEIMTREFLYRQVKIHGYYRKQGMANKSAVVGNSKDPSQGTEWSALTSN